MIRSADTTAVILSGGRSSRMGSDKAFLTIHGVTFMQRLLTLASSIFPHVLISANDVGKYAEFGVPVLPDAFPDAGPLAGIHACMTHASTPFLFLLTCDVPMLSAEVIRHVLRHARKDEVTLAATGHEAPLLCGVLPRRIEPVLKRALSSGNHRALSVLMQEKFSVLDCSLYADCLVGINTREEYERLLGGAW
jgi:molybdopterin-guanine dinucleotide biosynthesis protein A